MGYRFLGCLFFVLFFSSHVAAGGLEQGFSWTAPDNASATGTKIYVGTETGVYPNSEDAGVDTTTYNMDDLTCETTYYVVATHYSTEYTEVYESDMCPEVSFTTPACMAIIFNPMPALPDPAVMPIPLFNAE